MATDDRSDNLYLTSTGAPIQPISGAPTSVVAFIGRTATGPALEPILLTDAADFTAIFGPAADQPVGRAVTRFFQNGGGSAIVVRVAAGMAGVPLDRNAYRDGLQAAAGAAPFNLLGLPPDQPTEDVPLPVLAEALALCVTTRAMLLVDAPVAWSEDGASAVTRAAAGIGAITDALAGDAARNAALYFPPLTSTAPGGLARRVAPSSSVAGVMARIDQTRGVWKAPAGTDATITGEDGLSLSLTDRDGAHLNSLGINCLRLFPAYGRVIWGARTLRGADRLVDEFKYIPVRRLALFIEDSVTRGLQWALGEPPDERLWSRVRRSVGDFLHGLFTQGAFQGSTPSHAFAVLCGTETMTPEDIALGRLTVRIGFAPLRPAELVWIDLPIRRT